MPFADNNSTRIHYETDGQGPPLVLQHGMTQTLRSWYDGGYVDVLKQDYRLILVDARGHGQSDKPHDPQAYELRTRVGDVLAVMDDAGVDQAHYMGFSLGGRIGFGIAMHALDRFHSLIIGGMSALPSLDAFDPQLQADLLRKGMAAYVAEAETREGPLPADRKAVLLANDSEAMAASVLAPRGTDGIETLLQTLNVPCLLYCGDADGFYAGSKSSAELIPGAVFATIAGLDHGQTSRAGDQVLPHVTKFLKAVTENVGAAR